MTQSSSRRPGFGSRFISYLPTPRHAKPLRSRVDVNLELHQLDRYHKRAEKALTKTIDAFGNLDGDVDTNRWKNLRSNRGVRLFRGCYSVGPTPLLCVGTLHARFDDVMEGLYCDTTEEMALMNTIKCSKLIDSAVLKVVQKQTRLEPYAFTGIKCATIKLTMVNNRDLCYFDKMGMVRQVTGQRMGYHVMQSVGYPHKSMQQFAQVSLCYLFEELEDDLVGVYMQGEIDTATLSYFATKAASDALLSFVNALECTRAKKLALMMSTNRLGVWKCSSSRKNCCVCTGSPSFFESFTNCAGCSKPVCKKCRCKETVLTPDAISSGHLKRTDFCRECFTKMNFFSVTQLRVIDSPKADNTTMEEQVALSMAGSKQSLMSFVFNISTQVQVLSVHSEVRASNLSSIGWASSSSEGEEVDIDNESEGGDVLNASRLKSSAVVIYEKAPANMTRQSRSSTISTTSSYAHDDEDTEQHQTSLMAKLQQISIQVDETLLFTREQSEVARSVQERSRSRRLLQERTSSSSSLISL
ncbi:hypothetical protein PHMEG_0007892 [Phytophthora megakarya]|uniref:FYVE-type domain-containing protein n=1 Tax=Phytophthora megakarya TaxID=4795 RepID=A0A225WM43_9STRA|nr:hypothetical protein PHMEG_0007892 [Phytophthora megakarya]